MEKVGLLRIFKRSIEKIVATGIAKAVENVYGDENPVIKQECIGYYQSG